MNCRYLFSLLFFLFAGCYSVLPAYADEDTLLNTTIHFNKEKGLPTDYVYSCVQDKYGYIWMATEKGVVKYNGYSFKIFTTADGLPSNDVWRVYPDDYGRIWLCSHSYELGYIKNDVYKTVYRSDEVFSVISIASIQGIIIYRAISGLWAIDGKDMILKIPVDLDNNMFVTGYDNKLYRHNTNGKLYVTDIGSDSMTTTVYKGPGPNEMSIKSRYIFANDLKEITYQLNSDKLLLYNIAKNTVQTFSLTDYGGDQDEVIYILAYDELGGYYVLTQKGIYYLDKQLKLLCRKPVKNILPGVNHVTYISKDHFRNIWYSTLDNGVWMELNNPSIFLPERKIKTLDNAVFVGSIKNGKTFWWSSPKRALYCVDSNHNIAFTRHFSSDILCISQHDDSTVNVSFTENIYRYDLAMTRREDFIYDKPLHTINMRIGSERVEKLDSETTDSLRHLVTRACVYTHQYNNNMLYMCPRGYIIGMTTGTDSNVMNGFFHDRYTKMFYDSCNNIYWGYNNGKISLVWPASNKKINLLPSVLRILGIKNISHVCTDEYGNVYVLTGGKLCVFNTRTLALRNIDLNFDASDAFIAAYENTLILAGKWGISYSRISEQGRLSDFKVVFNHFSKTYEMVTGLYISASGEVFMSTDNSVFTFSVDSLKNIEEQYFTDGRDFTQLNVTTDNTIHSLHDGDSISLAIGVNRFSFDLVNFYGHGNGKYKYRINSGDWQTTTSGDVLYDYTPGSYYKVELFVEDALWHSNKHVFYIMQTPRWWQTTTWQRIFLAGGILLLIGISIIVALVTRYYVRKANDRKQALTDMELRALYAQINPHFIFNTLGTAQFFINGNKMEEAYNHVNKFARLLRAYLKASGNRYVSLGEEISLLKDYIELQQIRFEQKFDYRIQVDNKIAQDGMQIPTLLLQPLVENAINHGLFHLPENKRGLLVIEFIQGKSSEELICIIEDNGVGRERSKALKKDSTIEKDTSYGTTLTKKLIDIFKEYEKMNIYLEYVDKPAPKTGTLVKLTIGNIKYVT